MSPSGRRRPDAGQALVANDGGRATMGATTGTPGPGARVDTARAVVLPGAGAAIRLPGLVCLLQPPEGGELALGHLARLVEILTENSAAHPATPGRPLARRLARWLGSLDPGPDFGTVAATDGGIAIFLHGAVDAVVGGQRHSARDSGAWLDRLLDHPGGPLMLIPSAGPTPDNSPRAVFDLRGGVVPAGAVLLLPRSGTLPSALATPPLCATTEPGAGVRAGAGPAPAEPPAVPGDAVVPAPAAASSGGGARPGPAPRPAPAASPAAPVPAAAAATAAESPAAGAWPSPSGGVESTPPAPLPAVLPAAPAGWAADGGAPAAAGAWPAAPSPPGGPGAPHPPRPPAGEVTALGGALPGTPTGPQAARISPILGVGPDEPPRAPLDAGAVPHPPWPAQEGTNGAAAVGAGVAGAPAQPGQDGGVAVPMAAGFRCARDHLNDPRNHFCVICGIRMSARTGVVEVGPRPPLGLLVFDDGSTYTLDADYLLGRMPESDPRVVGGELRPLPVDDPEAQLSRGHLVIRLEGWDVTAIDESTNGTLVAHASDQAWSRLTPRTPLRLLPGTRVRVGGRSFVFESPSGVR